MTRSDFLGLRTITDHEEITEGRLRMHDRAPSAIDQLLRTAIASKRLIQFDYEDYPRIAEPHDYGVIGGEKQLLVYQIGGQSRSGTIPNWRLVRVAAMNRVQILNKEFAGGRSIPSGKHKKWDQLIARVEGPGGRLRRKVSPVQRS